MLTFGGAYAVLESGGDGSAICATYWQPFDQTVELVNTIISNQSVGINASDDVTVEVRTRLWIEPDPAAPTGSLEERVVQSKALGVGTT